MSGDGRAEAARNRWLRSRFPTADIVIELADESGCWLVTSALPGHPAHRPELHGDVSGLAAAIGTAVRRLHDVPVGLEDFPFDVGWDAVAAEVDAAVAGGQIDPSAMPAPYCRYGAAELAAIWRDNHPGEPPADRVLCHGDPSLPNLLFEGPSLRGVVDVGRLCLADRHLDLAVVHRSLQRNLGPESVFAFYDAYRSDPDLVRLDHYLLADLLR